MLATTATPLVVGPMDPDNTAELTRNYGVGNNSLELLRGQADNQPPELMAILAVPADSERSEALVLDEVIRAAGDLLDRDGSRLLSAYVRGSTDMDRVVTISYEVASGRTGKAALGPWVKGFPQSYAAWDGLRRQKMGLASAGASLTGGSLDASPELAEMRKVLEEQAVKLAELQNPEPVEGYREMNATDAATSVYEMDASQLDAVLRFEDNTGSPRVTVQRAVEKRREDLAAEAADLAALKAARAAGTDPLAPAPAESGTPAAPES